MNVPFKLGITGLPGAGKSTIARLFGELGAAVFDADAVVHRLYAPGGAAARELAELAPEVMDAAGGVNREKLRALLRQRPALLKALEAFVHPLVAEAREQFLQQAAADGVALAVLEIPLLFETGAEEMLDAVLLADAPRDVRLARLRQRPGLDEALLQMMEERQLPLAEKRALADYRIDTSAPLEQVRQQVLRLSRSLTAADRATARP